MNNITLKSSAETQPLLPQQSIDSNRLVGAAKRIAHTVSSFFTAIGAAVKGAVTHCFDAIRHKFCVQTPFTGVVIKHDCTPEAEKELTSPLINKSETSSQTEVAQQSAPQTEPALAKSRLTPRLTLGLIVLAGLAVASGAAYLYYTQANQCPNPFGYLPRPRVDIDQCSPEDVMAETFRNDHIFCSRADEPTTSYLWNAIPRAWNWITGPQNFQPSNRSAS